MTATPSLFGMTHRGFHNKFYFLVWPGLFPPIVTPLSNDVSNMDVTLAETIFTGNCCDGS